MFHRKALSLVTTWTAESPTLSIRGVDSSDNKKKPRGEGSDGRDRGGRVRGLLSESEDTVGIDRLSTFEQTWGVKRENFGDGGGARGLGVKINFGVGLMYVYV